MKFILSLSLTILASIGLNAKCIQGNCFSGYGVYVFNSGAKYKGNFKKGLLHGKGIFYFSNGDRYTGDWKDQNRHGYGKFVFKSGNIYTGYFVKNAFEGKGTMEYTNGEKYKGDWVDNEKSGKGIYFFNNREKYDGEFKDGQFHGKGSYFYSDGAVFVGMWDSNRKHGQGSFFSNGEVIAGNWDQGVLKEHETSLAETSSISRIEAHTFNYDLKDCNTLYCKAGKGTYTYADGTRFEGEFKDGKPHGEGITFYSSGDRYIGGWVNHAPEGRGVMHFTNGKVYGALWEEGKPLKETEAREKLTWTNNIEVDRSSEVKIWAVVVGVARYDHMPTLKYSDDDAYQVYAFLKSPEGGAIPETQLKVLVDEDATRENIIEAMQNTFLQADENDVVMLYYSGHGLDGSFLPIDFDGYNNKLRHYDVKKILEKSKAKHKVCIADACYSGSLLASKDGFSAPLNNYYNKFLEVKGGTAFLMSSKQEEVSLEAGGLRQGVFSHYVLKGLKGDADKNDNKIITISELYKYVYKHVRDYSGNTQTPILAGDYDALMPVGMMRN